MTQHLILSPRFTEDSIKVRAAALASGWTVHRPSSWRLSDTEMALAGNPRVALYGESLLCAKFSQDLGLDLLAPPPDFLLRVNSEHTLRTITFCTAREALSWPHRAFFKPADDKWFSAGVYASGADVEGLEQLPPDDPILISDVVAFTSEFRFFVLESGVVAQSVYMRHGELAPDDYACTGEEATRSRQFAQAVLSATPCPPAFVLDVGQLDDGRWAVIEANPAWGAGIYGCEPDAVLSVLAAATVAPSEIDAALHPWLLSRPHFERESG